MGEVYLLLLYTYVYNIVYMVYIGLVEISARALCVCKGAAGCCVPSR